MGNKIALKPGDCFCSRNPMALGRAINALQWFWSKDGESTYSHAGIITTPTGDTFEALGSTRQNHLKHYAGEGILIARPNSVNLSVRLTAIQNLMKEHEGQWYPFWRLALFALGPVAKIGVFERLVCSELVAKYLHKIKVRHGQYKGTNPDTLADEWRTWQVYDVIFEGEFNPEKILI